MQTQTKTPVKAVTAKPISRTQAMTTKGKALVAKGKAIAPKPTKVAATKTTEPGAIESMKQSKRKLTMSSDAREQIRGGMSRVDLRTHLATKWNLPESKKWYANWYFADAKRRGIKTVECSAK